MLHNLTLIAPLTSKDQSIYKVQVGRIEWLIPCIECKANHGEVLVVRFPADDTSKEPEPYDYYIAPCGHQFQEQHNPA